MQISPRPISPVYASAGDQVCAQSGTGYCLNDWGGQDNLNDKVAMYYNDGTNDNFFKLEPISDCNGPGGTQCVQAVYLPSEGQYCLATNDDGFGILGNCGGSGGANASYGVIDYLIGGGPGCSSSGLRLENRYWTDYYGCPQWVESSGTVGVQVTMDGSDGNGSSCWDVVS